MTFPSGAYKGKDDDLFCRMCGRMADIENGRLSCALGHFDEEFTPEEGMEY